MADGKWLDLWGKTLGNALRLTGESDAEYNVRLMKEVQRSRLTINALQLIVKQDLGLPIIVTNDAHDFVFIVGGGPTTVPSSRYPGVSVGKQSEVGGGPHSINDKILPDRVHSHDTINVGVPGNITAAQLAAIKAKIERNRAWGIMPIYQPGIFGLITTHGTVTGSIFVIAGAHDRVTRIDVEVINAGTSKGRVTRADSESLRTGAVSARATRADSESLRTGNTSARVTRADVEVLHTSPAPPGAAGRTTRLSVEILRNL